MTVNSRSDVPQNDTTYLPTVATSLNTNAQCSQYSYTRKGLLISNGYAYSKTIMNGRENTIHWRCADFKKYRSRRSMRRILVSNKKPLHQTIKSTQRKIEQTIFVQPKLENDEKQPFINPENVIKSLDNGHALVMLKRTRVKGYCVECIKKSGDPAYKKSMTKIITYCPQCPGGNWICASCFDILHNVEEYLLP